MLGRMATTKPSPALLREMSDESVLRALMDQGRLTRAELSVVTGLSKPTAGEAVRRLKAAGLVRDTGVRTSSRGGVGTYYALAADLGSALAVSIAPGSVLVELLDVAGAVLDRVIEAVQRPASPEDVAAALRRCVLGALRGRRGVVAVVSAANPVNRTSGELVHLPGAPFLLGPISPGETLAPLVEGPVVVDNDVNWAARAERAVRARSVDNQVEDFAYLYLGEGVGCAVVSDGEVRRGHRGLAGEVGYLLVRGPGGQAVPLTVLFGHLGLCHPGSTAIDVERLLRALAAANGEVLAHELAEAISGVVEAAIAFADPALVVIGGPWGRASSFLTELGAALSELSSSTRLEAPQTGDNAALAGARAAAVQGLRSEIIALINKEGDGCDGPLRPTESR